MKRLRIQEREMAAREVWKVREAVGRGFLRRGVLVGRSEGVSLIFFFRCILVLSVKTFARYECTS